MATVEDIHWQTITLIKLLLTETLKVSIEADIGWVVTSMPKRSVTSTGAVDSTVEKIQWNKITRVKQEEEDHAGVQGEVRSILWMRVQK
jgi:hypothetical protein